MTNQGTTQAPDQSSVTPAKMDAALKAKWVEALRSGDYKQAQKYLRRDGGFCCLGVLCEISGLSSWTPGLAFDDWWYGDRTTGGYQYLPQIVREAAQITSDECDPLMDMNDDGKSFSEIADYIERML